MQLGAPDLALYIVFNAGHVEARCPFKNLHTFHLWATISATSLVGGISDYLNTELRNSTSTSRSQRVRNK